MADSNYYVRWTDPVTGHARVTLSNLSKRAALEFIDMAKTMHPTTEFTYAQEETGEGFQTSPPAANLLGDKSESPNTPTRAGGASFN